MNFYNVIFGNTSRVVRAESHEAAARLFVKWLDEKGYPTKLRVGPDGHPICNSHEAGEFVFRVRQNRAFHYLHVLPAEVLGL